MARLQKKAEIALDIGYLKEILGLLNDMELQSEEEKTISRSQILEILDAKCKELEDKIEILKNNNNRKCWDFTIEKERDIFVDISITGIVMLVGIYSMYEYKFDFKRLVVILYVLLLLMSIAYILLVLHNDKKAKLDETNNLIDTEKEKVSGDKNVD